MSSQLVLYNDNLTKDLSKDKKLSLLVSVLLEIVFGNNSVIYEQTLDYLIKTNVIDSDIENEEYSSTRLRLFNMITQMNSNGPNKLLTDDSSVLINTYNKTFNELEEIGSGSFASVYKAQHKIDSRIYAIKKIIITDDLIDLGYDVFDEVKMLSSLNHPNVLRYCSSWIDFDINSISRSSFNSEIDNDSNSDTSKLPVLFIQTELCDFTLKDYIEDKSINDGFEQRLAYWKQMVEGVEYIHSQNIIHRDIKPSNIFFLNGQIKIGDFGLSKNISKFALQINKSVEIGCAYYRAPEVETGEYNESIDIYSLGVILLELMLECNTTYERIKTIKTILKNRNFNIINMLTNKFNDLILELISFNRPTCQDIFKKIADLN